MNVIYFAPGSSNCVNHFVEKFKIFPDLSAYFEWILRGIFVVNVLFGILYLMILNGLATRGFDLENIKMEQVKLQKQNEEIDISVAIPSSIYALESNEMVQEMATVSKKEYVRVLKKEVAFLK